MNRSVITITLFLLVSFLLGQTTFMESAISTDVNGAHDVHVADVDGDGDMDVLSASWSDGIAWHENDGSENFTRHDLAQNSSRSVYAIDVDSDGDIDILAGFWWTNMIAWYENDGSESFTEHVISDSADGPSSVRESDVD